MEKTCASMSIEEKPEQSYNKVSVSEALYCLETLKKWLKSSYFMTHLLSIDIISSSSEGLFKKPNGPHVIHCQCLI